MALAWRCRLVVAEEPFCSPWLAGLATLAAGKFRAPVFAVDADRCARACVCVCVCE